MKGGNKVLEIYHNLKGRGFQCTLTIVGSEPPMSLPNDPNIEIYPFIDKTNSNDSLNVLQNPFVQFSLVWNMLYGY